MNSDEKVIEVNLIGLILDPVSKTPVMILKPIRDSKVIPIWIGGAEANSITMELENISPPRPMTHDLIQNIIYHFDTRIDKIIVSDIIENTYYAELYLKKGDQVSVIDCRPSDAVALALKNKCRIYISENVYNSTVLSDHLKYILNDEERLKKWFDALSPEDFGKVEQ